MLLLALLINSELVVHRGHTDTVWSATFSRDGRYVATGSADGTVRLWDLASLKDIRVFAGHDKRLIGATMSDDGTVIMSASPKLVLVHDVMSGRERLRFAVNDLNAAVMSPDGKSILTATYGGEVTLWRDGKSLRTIQLSRVWRMSYSRDGSLVAIAHDGGAQVWDASLVNRALDLKIHGDATYTARFSDDGRFLVTGGGDNTAKLWTVRGELRATFLHSDRVNDAAVTPDGRTVITGSWNQNATWWDVATAREVRTVSPGKNLVNLVELSRAGDYVLTAGATSVVWETATGRMVGKLEGRVAEARAAASAADGRLLLVGTNDRSAKLWDLTSGKQVRVFGHDRGVLDVAMSEDGKYAVTYGGDVRAWDVQSGRMLAQLRDQKSMFDLAMSPDGSRFVTGGSNGDSLADNGAAHVYETQTGKRVHTFSYPRGVYALAYHDKRLAIAGHEKWVKIYDAETFQEVCTATSPEMSSTESLAFTPDGKWILAGTGLQVFIWAADTCAVKRHWRVGDGAIYALASDGKTVLTSAMQSELHVWSFETGESLGVLRGHNGWITNARFGSPGTWLTTSTDGSTKLWQAETKSEIATLLSMGENDFAIVAPDRYYTASKGAARGVSFVDGLRALAFDNIDLVYNRPDLVLSRLGPGEPALVKAYRGAYTKRLQKAGLREDQLRLDAELPEVALVGQPPPAESRAKTISFTVNARDAKHAISRVNVFVNEVPVFGSAGLPGGPSTPVTLTLSNGVNNVEFSARNDQGVESFRRGFTVKYVGPPAPVRKQVFAVGVSAYQDASMRLNYAAKDAGDLAALFRATPILDAKARREAILALNARLKATQVDDEVVLFFAGHGLLDDKLDWYFATQDIDFANPAKRGVSYDEIEALLDGIPARKKLLLVDACHSGEVDKTEASAPVTAAPGARGVVKQRGFKVRPGHTTLAGSFRLMQELFASLERGSGTMVLSSASGSELAFESPEWKNGVFTYSLLEALKTKAPDKDKSGTIEVSEARDYVISRVSELTQGKQNPTSRREVPELDFTLR